MNKRKQRQEDTRNAAKYCKADNVTSFESGVKWADTHKLKKTNMDCHVYIFAKY